MKKRPRIPKPIRNPVAEAVLISDVRAAIRADVANLKTAQGMGTSDLAAMLDRAVAAA